MATLLPPPKRQKLNFDPAKHVEAPAPADVPHVVIQFKNAEDGSFLGPAINLPANTGRDAMQMLVNKLRGEVSSLPCFCVAGKGNALLNLRFRTDCRTPPIRLPPRPKTVLGSINLIHPTISPSSDQFLHSRRYPYLEKTRSFRILP